MKLRNLGGAGNIARNAHAPIPQQLRSCVAIVALPRFIANQDHIPKTAIYIYTDQCGSGQRLGAFWMMTQFVFSGSDDDFDAGLDEEFDPLEREQSTYVYRKRAKTH